jgi:hypothetical protein
VARASDFWLYKTKLFGLENQQAGEPRLEGSNPSPSVASRSSSGKLIGFERRTVVALEMRAVRRVLSGVRQHRIGAIGLALEACEQGLDDERIELASGAALQLRASGFLAD